MRLYDKQREKDYKTGWEAGIAESRLFTDPEPLEVSYITSEIPATAYQLGYVDGWNAAATRSTVIFGDYSAQTGGQITYPRVRKEVQ